MSVNDVLQQAYEHVKECKDVFKTMHEIGLEKAHLSDLSWVNRMTDYLDNESEKILDELEIEFEKAGWWKKKVIKSWYNDVGAWTAKIKVSRGQLNYFKEKKS
jgi:hypothetical protein